MDFDLTDLDLFADGFPHEVFRWLRREAPIYWHPATPNTPDAEGFWVVSRHADVLTVFHDTETYSSEGGGGRERGGTFLQDTPYGGVMINMMDPPRHNRIRSLVNKGFSARGVAALETELRARAQHILDPIAERSECEFVGEVARELPLQAICGILGVRQEDRDTLCDDMEEALEQVNGEAGQQSESRMQAMNRVTEYGGELIAEKRRKPEDDMLSAVIHAELPGEDPSHLTDFELQLFFFLLFVAGSETTRKAIAGGVKALIDHPGELARLRAKPEQMSSAIEEIVRWTTPSAYKRRTLTVDADLAGARLRAGQKLLVWEMSANHDDAVFAEPFRFDVERNPNPHLGFGHGIHYCLGANLARLEIRILLEALLERFDEFSVAGPVEWTRDNRLFGIKALPLRLKSAAGG